MARYTHDILVIGGGAAGLTVAAGTAQLGLKTALFEPKKLGGDCLYHGCVPSKSLLKTATVYQQLKEFPKYGLPETSRPRVDIKDVNARVQSVIDSIAYHDSPERFRKLGAEVFLGHVRFVSPHEVKFDDGNLYSAKRIVLATGSSPRAVPIPGLEDAGYLTNLDMFSLDALPKKLIVLGGGPIGVEMSQAFTRLGTEVSVIDVAPQLLPREDADMAAFVADRLRAEGAALYLGAKVQRVEASGGSKTVVLEHDGAEVTLTADDILVATGRKGNTDDLDLEKAGVAVEKSFITTDAKLRTSQKHIVAIGDCNGRFLFTHVAGAEGSLAVRRLALHAGGVMSYRNVPWCTYTDPELANIGYNERAAEEAGITYQAITQPFSGIDRTHAEAEPEGMMKILVDPKERVIGAQVAGIHAGELLMPSVFAVSQGWKLKELMSPIYPYPTLSEITRKTVSAHMGPKLFNDKVRGILRFLFRYRGVAGSDHHAEGTDDEK